MQFMSSLMGLLSFICLPLACIFQRKLRMTSIMSMKELLNVYKARGESAPILMMTRPLMFTLPVLELEIKPTMPLTPLIDVITFRLIIVTSYIIICNILPNNIHMEILQTQVFSMEKLSHNITENKSDGSQAKIDVMVEHTNERSHKQILVHFMLIRTFPTRLLITRETLSEVTQIHKVCCCFKSQFQVGFYIYL